MKIKKYKSKKNRSNRFRNKSNRTKKQKQRGSGMFKSIGNFIVNVNPPRNTSYRSPLTSTLNLFDFDQYSQNSNQQQNIYFQIYYNYNSPKPFHLNTNINRAIPSSIVEMEPRIVIGNMNRYLVVFVDDQPFNRLLWAAEFSNNSRKKNILSYLSPIPKGEKKHNYFIKFYTYPAGLPPFTVMDISGQKRKEEYTNFITYINNPQYKDKIRLVKQFPLNIYKDKDSGLTLFNVFKKIGKNTQPTTAPVVAPVVAPVAAPVAAPVVAPVAAPVVAPVAPAPVMMQPRQAIIASQKQQNFKMLAKMSK